MARRVVVSESELIEALREASGKASLGPADAFTLAEIRAATGLGVDAVTAHILRLKAAGAIRVVRVTRIAIDDTRRNVPAYQFVKAA